MSYREKVAWVFLIPTAVVYGPYFYYVAVLAADDRLVGGAGLGLFIMATVALTLLSVAAGIGLAVSRVEPKDERDAAIDSKALRNAYYVFAVLSMSAVLAVVCGAVPKQAWWAEPAVVGQVFFFCFVVAELVHYSTVVVCYRRGA